MTYNNELISGVIRHLYNLQSDHLNKSSTHLIYVITTYSYYNIIDYIPHAVLYIPMTIL